MINRIVLVGRLTRDPELKKTNSGNSICSFTVACDNPGKGPNGEKTTSYIPCVVWNAQADNVSKFTRKGSLVGVDGRLNQRKYQKQDGTNASIFEVVCDSVRFLEPKNANEKGEVFDDTPVVNETSSKNLDSIDLPDDDLPF